MYLWHRTANPKWWHNNEGRLRSVAANQLVVIERPSRRRLELEVSSGSRSALLKIVCQFGGTIRKLPTDWLKRSLRRKTKPLKIGNKNLLIPAGTAFGTGEHATTGMSLKFLERVIRV